MGGLAINIPPSQNEERKECVNTVRVGEARLQEHLKYLVMRLKITKNQSILCKGQKGIPRFEQCVMFCTDRTYEYIRIFLLPP